MGQIVVGVDESQGAARALRWAVRQGELHGWSTTAVMAWGLLDQHRPGGDRSFDPQYGEQQAAEALDAIVTEAVVDAAGSVERRVVCDRPAQALLDAAVGSDLLVVGARGLGGFRGLLLGSVSQHCLHHATSPVAVVRGDGAAPEDDVRRVIVAVDGSDTANRALRWAVTEADVRGVPLVVLNAWHPPYVGAEYAVAMNPTIFEKSSTEVIDQAIASCDPDRVPVERVPIERISAEGGPAQVILDTANADDLVVMGARGIGGFAGMVLGSVTNHVTRHAPCPVIVIRPA
jgi:nucleotide-binding universal stress UspA family protein